MTHAKFTPGPWAVTNIGAGTPGHRPTIVNSDVLTRIVDGNPKYICDVRGPGFGWPASQETEANAHLIASAPDLLSALKLCRETLVLVSRDCPCDLAAAMQAARDAIAKAEGGGQP
jgi:hypothetical protein